jgi:hypothetical protein
MIWIALKYVVFVKKYSDFQCKLVNFRQFFTVKHDTACVFLNPEIPGFMNFQSRDPGSISNPGIPGSRNPGLDTLDTTGGHGPCNDRHNWKPLAKYITTLPTLFGLYLWSEFLINSILNWHSTRSTTRHKLSSRIKSGDSGRFLLLDLFSSFVNTDIINKSISVYFTGRHIWVLRVINLFLVQLQVRYSANE